MQGLFLFGGERWDSHPLRREPAKTAEKQGFRSGPVEVCDHRCVPPIRSAGSSISADFGEFPETVFGSGSPLTRPSSKRALGGLSCVEPAVGPASRPPAAARPVPPDAKVPPRRVRRGPGGVPRPRSGCGLHQRILEIEPLESPAPDPRRARPIRPHTWRHGAPDLKRYGLVTNPARVVWQATPKLRSLAAQLGRRLTVQDLAKLRPP